MAAYFFISLAVLVVSLICAFLNLCVVMAGKGLNDRTMFLHVLCALGYAIGGLASLITGVIWIVQQFA